MRAAKLFVAMLCLLFVGMPSTTSEARDERKWQRQYCEGMTLEQHLDYGGYVDCLSPEYAIEVEWANKWAEAVGQSLYYAARTARKPGIILLCEKSEGRVEGECRSYAYRLAEALKFVHTHVYVWMCHIDKDVKLDGCDRDPPPLTPEPPSPPAAPVRKPPQAGAHEDSSIAAEQEFSLPPLHDDQEAVPHRSGIFACVLLLSSMRRGTSGSRRRQHPMRERLSQAVYG